MSFLKPSSHKRAVTYHRHSAEDKQENSVSIQREHAETFASKNDIEIIHEEADEGVSGLIAERPGFQRLLQDWVLDPGAPHFDYILVYDVSRWGRFQNQNMAAYYEHICEKHGKKIIYVSRGFPKEGQELAESIITPMERWMAAQYSKQLSEKVWHGSIRVSKDGYSAGGIPCYGMGRLLLDGEKKPIRLLKKGEQKQIANERVKFMPLDDETTQTVKDIYDMFVRRWISPENIAEILNDKGVLSPNGKSWDAQKIFHILTNETYTGTLVYNKKRGRLKQKIIANPRSEWVITRKAFPPVVSSEIFSIAQERLFWILPSRWRRNASAIYKVQKMIQKEIREVLLSNGMSEDEADEKLRMFPITYSASSSTDIFPYKFFVIEESARNHDNVFALSIAAEKKDFVEGFFLIPTSKFNASNFVMFSESDEQYKKYRIGPEKVFEAMSPFL